jgi:hypothetical protein
VNANEQSVHDGIASPNDVVIKMTATGNPDFIVIPKYLAPLIRFVEVKAGNDKVWPHQQAVHDELRSDGFTVDVLQAEDFAPDAFSCGCENCGVFPIETCMTCGFCRACCESLHCSFYDYEEWSRDLDKQVEEDKKQAAAAVATIIAERELAKARQ